MSKRSRARIKTAQRQESRAAATAAPPVRVPYRRLLSLLALFFATRLLNLNLHGLHYDELTYLNWAQLIGADWNQRFVGASFGKQPLHVWLLVLSERFVADPTIAGRLVSVFTGALSLVALWLVAARLFSTRVASLAALLYILVPYSLHFDRVALVDSLLTAEYTWLLYFAIRLVDGQRPLRVVGLASAFGAALLTKSVGWAFPFLLPAALLVSRPDRRRGEHLYRWAAAVCLGLVGGFIIYYLLFGSNPASTRIGQFEREHAGYTMPLSTLLTFPWQKWADNAGSVLRWYYDYVTPPLALVAAASLVASVRLGRAALLLAPWAILPILGQIAIANLFYERHILFTIPPTLILTAHVLDCAYERLPAWPRIASATLGGYPVARPLAPLVFASLTLWPVVEDVGLLTDFNTANRRAGGFQGFQEMRGFIAQRARAGPVYVAVSLLPSPVQDGADIFLRDVPNVKVLRVAPFEGKLTIFDPANQQAYLKQFFQGKELYYADQPGAEAKSWLAGRLLLANKFSHKRVDDENDYVGLYRVNLDDSFR